MREPTGKVDRTAFGDRLELLLFHLSGRQRFGINVLKVKEVIACPHLTHVPKSHPSVRGIAHLRGEPLTVIDLAAAIGRPSIIGGEQRECDASVIITEFNRSMQGFLVSRVDRIVVCDWKSVLPPPRATGAGSYITGVTEIGEELVQVLDVEKVLGEVVVTTGGLAVAAPEDALPHLAGKRLLVVDDSSLARHQTAHTLEQIGVEYLMARDGKEALELLRRLAENPDEWPVSMVISDIEMPEMDGYTLTREIRGTPKLSGLYVLLHTSLNGAINTEQAQKAGADAVLTKFVPEELAKAVVAGLQHAV